MDAEGWDAILTLAGPGELTLHSFRRRCSISVVLFIEIRWMPSVKSNIKAMHHEGHFRSAPDCGFNPKTKIQNWLGMRRRQVMEGAARPICYGKEVKLTRVILPPKVNC